MPDSNLLEDGCDTQHNESMTLALSASRVAAVSDDLKRDAPGRLLLTGEEDVAPYECDGLAAYRQLAIGVVLRAFRPGAQRYDDHYSWNYSGRVGNARPRRRPRCRRIRACRVWHRSVTSNGEAELNLTERTTLAIGEVLAGRRAGVRAKLLFAGPAIIASNAYMDPGNFATNLQAGFRYGHALLRIVLAANIIAMLFQALSAKLGIVTNRNLVEMCRERFPAMAGQVIMQGFVGFRILVWLRRIATMVPSLVAEAFGVKPTGALVYSQVVLSFVLPVPMIAWVVLPA